jgi:hypothetical protein
VSVSMKDVGMNILVLDYVWGGWRGDESPLQIIAQRCGLAAYLRGEGPECSPKPRAFMSRCSPLAMTVGMNAHLCR